MSVHARACNYCNCTGCIGIGMHGVDVGVGVAVAVDVGFVQDACVAAVGACAALVAAVVVAVLDCAGCCRYTCGCSRSVATEARTHALTHPQRDVVVSRLGICTLRAA